MQAHVLCAHDDASAQAYIILYYISIYIYISIDIYSVVYIESIFKACNMIRAVFVCRNISLYTIILTNRSIWGHIYKLTKTQTCTWGHKGEVVDAVKTHTHTHTHNI
jgi:hypothetical protein